MQHHIMAGIIHFQKGKKATIIKELNRFCELGILEFQNTSEWASPSFIITKADQTVQMISDFREVNKLLVRNPFPLPKISIYFCDTP